MISWNDKFYYNVIIFYLCSATSIIIGCGASQYADIKKYNKKKTTHK